MKRKFTTEFPKNAKIKMMTLDESRNVLHYYTPRQIEGPSPTYEERIGCEMRLAQVQPLVLFITDQPNASKSYIDWNTSTTCTICCLSKSCPRDQSTNQVLTPNQLHDTLTLVQWEDVCRNKSNDFIIQYICGHPICRNCLYIWYYVFGRTDCDTCKNDKRLSSTLDVGLLECLLESFYHPNIEYRHARRHALERKQSQYRPTLQQRLVDLLVQDPYNYDISTPCGKCGTLICHTTDCHTLCHCHTETCFVCGETAQEQASRSASSCMKLPPCHWKTPEISGGCPRYAHDPFWNDIANCEFVCRQGPEGCYDHDRICSVVTHTQGKRNYAYCLYQFRLYYLWIRCMTKLDQDNFQRKYPQYESRITTCRDLMNQWIQT